MADVDGGDLPPGDVGGVGALVHKDQHPAILIPGILVAGHIQDRAGDEVHAAGLAVDRDGART